MFFKKRVLSESVVGVRNVYTIYCADKGYVSYLKASENHCISSFTHDIGQAVYSESKEKMIETCWVLEGHNYYPEIVLVQYTTTRKILSK